MKGAEPVVAVPLRVLQELLVVLDRAEEHLKQSRGPLELRGQLARKHGALSAWVDFAEEVRT